MRVFPILLFVACSAFGGTTAADALHDRDNGPLTGIFGLPDSRDGGRLARPGEQEWEISLATSSHSVRDEHNEESVLLDGETSRFVLRFRRGVGGRLELGFEVPWLMHESGNLDSFIDGWHGIFGLPDGIRDERPRDRLEFRYFDTGRLLQLDSNSRGLGDVRLTAGWQLSASDDAATALRFGLKLPTGDSERLLGSGGTDVSIGIAGQKKGLGGLGKIDGFWSAHAVWLGPHDLDIRRSNEVVGQFSAGIGYALNGRTSVLVQTMVRTPVYDSGVSPAGDVAAALTMGFHIRLSAHYSLALAVGEDIHPESMPDVTFRVSLRRN